MEKTIVTAVSYLNTLPFVYGINTRIPKEEVFLSLDVPSECARKIIHHEVDFGLAPSGILSQIMPQYNLLPYCIGADGAVSSVMLFSRVPMSDITKVYLDVDSRTSVLLVRLLAKHLWNISPEWVDQTVIREANEAQSLLAIGDKAFALKGEFPYYWDLGLEWKKMTGLPFVFAVWVTRTYTFPQSRKVIEDALEYGVSHIQQAIDNCPKDKYLDIDLVTYLNHDIHYRMTDTFQEGLDLFLDMVKELERAG